jgi:hypothetical protein
VIVHRWRWTWRGAFHICVVPGLPIVECLLYVCLACVSRYYFLGCSKFMHLISVEYEKSRSSLEYLSMFNLCVKILFFSIALFRLKQFQFLNNKECNSVNSH